MAMVGTMRFAPTVFEMGTIEQAWTTAIPACSICLLIVAPQRVQVPQVEVRITAWTPSATRSFAISQPYFSALATDVPLPTVA